MFVEVLVAREFESPHLHMSYIDYKKQREYQRLWRREALVRWRKVAIEKLGSKCVVCGYNENIQALQIDHIEPQLRALNQRAKTAGSFVYQQVATGKLSTNGLQLLCANHHAIKTFEDRKKFKNFIS